MLRHLALLFALITPGLAGAQTAAPPLPPDLMDQGFVAAQQGMTSAAGAALKRIGERTAARSGKLAEVLRQRQGLADRLRDVEDDLAAGTGDAAILAGTARQLTSEMAHIDRGIARDFPRYAALTRPDPLGMDAVAALLAPDEALILFFVGQEYTYVWAVTPRLRGWHRVAAGSALIAQTVADLRASVGEVAVTRAAVALEPTPPRAVQGFDRNLAAGVYRHLLAPLDRVIAGARHVYVVPDGALTSLPFALLVTDDDDPPPTTEAAALRATPWMIRRHAITTLPSVEALGVVRRLPPADAGRKPFAGFGDPVLEGRMALASLSRGPGLMRDGVANVDQLRALAPLPQTRRELLSIAHTLGAGAGAVRLGPEATESAVKAADLSRARVLAFATHGLLSGDLSGLAEPALVLTPPDAPSRMDDGLLTASEIADLRLDADWVVLSACNTAGGDTPGAEGLSGLARAFLFAGARSILVTHWPVRDDAAARLTTDAFARLAGGQARGKAEALQQAMLSLMDDTRDPTLADPAAWAPFALVGEGG